MRKIVLLLGIALLGAVTALGAIACGDDDEDDNGSTTPEVVTATEAAGETAEEGAISVNLTEYIVAPSRESAGAGMVTFTAKNIGGEEHELVVIRTDLETDQLPASADGSVDEAGEGIEVIGEIEEFPSGEERTASFELEAGAYVLICNVVEEHTAGEVISHYAEGMYAPFTVTE